MIINIKGGLGNQMFQYAFAYSVSQNNKTLLKLDISAFRSYDLRRYELDHYYLAGKIATIEESNQLKYAKESFIEKVYRKLVIKQKPFADTYYKEPHFQFDQTAIIKQNNMYFDGYWQSEKYFQDYRNDLLKLFTLKEDIHAKSKHYQQKILANNSVSLHIRRGDYVTDTKTNSVHGACALEYYQQAVAFIKKQVSKPHFFIFSDDLTWAKENLDFIKQITFIELDPDLPDHEEMWLMSQCQHNIIANSSFSWWGAWLNQHPNKIVIAPQPWFRDTSINTRDLTPDSWIRL